VTPQEILSGAAALIEAHGWVKGVYGDEEIGFCALGAMYRSHGELTTIENAAGSVLVPSMTVAEVEVFKLARQRLVRELVHSASITFWNDAVAESKDEVVETLRRAAADA
jgi:hypothetical protein